jgi:2-hydroxychromene-2-carboxylate isomerase
MGPSARRLVFWYEFASTYSYLSAMRIEDEARAADVEVVWKPFLLGPIFAGQGWSTSPFNIYPAKGRYMVRDLQRLAGERGLTFAMPEIFPQNSLAAARVALIGCEEGWVAPFTRAVYAAQFAAGADISDRSLLTSILDRLGLDSLRILGLTEDSSCKQHLKQQTAEAQALGIFGAPTFQVGTELFWGDDRLGQALRWAHA